MNGAQWVVHALRAQGVDTVFGYPGGAIMPVYDALYDGGVEHLLCRHEQGAAMAAIGYARATGKTGVCIATSGPGATNLITGLADALLDSVPVVAITGQVAAPLIGTDAFQEVDVLGLSLACTKHSFLVESLEELPEIMAHAFHLASSGRPGPVLIDIPKDIQLASGELEPWLSSVEDTFVVPQAELEQARTLLSQAEKPMLYVGGGVGMAQAVPALREFMAQTQIPCAVTLKGLGAVEASYPGYLGMLGMHGTKAANLAVQECDLLIAVGARFDDRVTGKLNTFAPHAKVIHMDIDPAELNKLRQAHVGLPGDLNALLPALQRPMAIDAWRERVAALRSEHDWRYDHPGEGIFAPLLLKQLSDRKPANSVVTTDVGQHQMWAAQHMRFSRPENFITSSGLGTMGFGLPAAVGAQVARPEDTVICVTGDGSFMMNIQELGTVKRKQLPLKIVLLDNQRLGMVRQWQQLFFSERYSETNLSDNPDFLTLASAFGIAGQRITRKDQVEAALETMFNSEGPYLLHVSIDEAENVWPLVPPGASNSQMLEKIS
ncbi:acetolactate synthase 2 catalytic subunit [Cronobacter turicensis]|jgi:acetolactate synthase-1/2/3 large subunit|uniref:Acetolactate synthase n=1 Tax=Cronobacter turicensis (strain DSM 18703 / CCUG 55852 / LMG 23827 / z3032) TaxID=693216 RepID=C9Y4S2_CROTZ|nr:acetolactate synthase 2 catalytic subunit [Cronobacter turicensis]CBA26997.1 Acetolactate synthase isozyme 2 large subunit [Cronobacter turicensis z3032]EGT5683877.1 acetolactate synthase 2 catalytic subunit [Cronobacter turicensis]EGT5742554.1 acetolactate synthase 2 catalytic subunit [Cronobacter turicensis]EKM0373809.1 acetolactate synthase 2 catalytic subunit [Cronobacter turicensis]ELQ6022959.1 acetolactate synthase 2 catalytic subunit [Cronobacter turicensis]